MDFLNVFFVGTAVGLVALGTTTTTASDFNVKSQIQVSASTVKLGTAADYAVLSEWGISNDGGTKITGNIGVSPGKETSIRNFDLKSANRGTFSKSNLVSGKVYAYSHKNPTPTKLTATIIDMVTAYTDAFGRVADVEDLEDGNLGGIKINPGVYKWNSDVTIEGDIILTGDSGDVWIFQVEHDLYMSPDTKIVLNGSAQVKNVFWQVAGETTLGENSTFRGTILGQEDITMQKGAILDGRALSQTRVSLDSNIINQSD